MSSLPRYGDVLKCDLFDVMRESLNEFYLFDKSKFAGNPVLVAAVDEVHNLKVKDVSRIFDVFYSNLAGDVWSDVCAREFYVDSLAQERSGLCKMRTSKREVVGLLDSFD